MIPRPRPVTIYLLVACIVFATIPQACGPMRDASPGDRTLDKSDISPPRLDLIQFSASTHIPHEFERAWTNGEICRDDSDRLVSPAIKQIIAGSHWRRGGGYENWEVVTRGEAVSPCDAPQGQTPDSPLQAIIRRLDQLHAQIPQLRPVTIELFPVFENAGNEGVTFATDDAFYDAGRETIVILPSSSITPRTRLWESPFVLAHELAHHAILTKFKLQIEDWCEEGNADLMAFRMTGENPQLIRELPGFGSDRDPSWPRFSGGENKASLDLLSPAPIHRKGAAFAHIAWSRNQQLTLPKNCSMTAR
jgi:hypothetical protein